MDKSSRRAALSFGLGMSGILGLISRARGQNTKAEEAANAAEGAPIRLGTLNVGAVLQKYEKVKTLSAEFKKDATERSNALTKLSRKAQEEAEALKGMIPGSPEYQATEAKLAQLKAEFDAKREGAQRDFSAREAEMMADLLREIHEVAGIVARRHNISVVLRTSSELTSTEPSAVMAAIEAAVVYAAPELDLTNEVLVLLNQRG